MYPKVAELKEVFMLFDRDEDGVLSFQELQVVMKSMGQRPSGAGQELTLYNLFKGELLQMKSCLRK